VFFSEKIGRISAGIVGIPGLGLIIYCPGIGYFMMPATKVIYGAIILRF